MIDFSRAELTHAITHYVGNKGLGEELKTTYIPLVFNDDFIKDTLCRYLLSPFKTDVYYHFKGKIDPNLSTVDMNTGLLFESRNQFVMHSQKIAKILYDQTIHPKIPGGQLYVCYFKDVVCDGELVDCVGIFKTEKLETFLQVKEGESHFEIGAADGINIKKLDKGALIFNTAKDKGYKISLIDANKINAECSYYWQEDFLNAKLIDNAYFHTRTTMELCRHFIEEKTEELQQLERLALMNASMNYFNLHKNFHIKEFEKEVLKDKDLIKYFNEYREDFLERNNLPEHTPIEFEISDTATKQNKKYMRQVIKLDQNFHLYIHANPDYMEKGYDEEKGMKYYKVYYVNED